jgi:hypothetical protein
VIVPLLVFAQLGSVQVHTTVAPETVYVGQQVSYDAATFVDDVARMHLRANPSYTPPEVRGATIYDFPFDTSAISDATMGGKHFRRYLYHRALFPLTVGTVNIPSATLQYALPEDDAYESPLRTYTLQSEPTTFVVLPLPAAGRPFDFAGAIGQFAIAAHSDGATPRVGDTFVYTVRISGVGNVNLLPRPQVNIPWANVVTGEERATWDSTGTTVRGAKEFDWIVTPKLAGEMILPEVSYSYFDPSTRRYATTTAESSKMNVAVAAGAPQAQNAGPRDSIGDSPFPVVLRVLQGNPILWGSIAIAILVLIILAVFLVRRAPSDE